MKLLATIVLSLAVFVSVSECLTKEEEKAMEEAMEEACETLAAEYQGVPKDDKNKLKGLQGVTLTRSWDRKKLSPNTYSFTTFLGSKECTGVTGTWESGKQPQITDRGVCKEFDPFNDL